MACLLTCLANDTITRLLDATMQALKRGLSRELLACSTS
nr:MAG: hypothetical protein H4Bulk4635978_000002 [Mitovirus sp.]QDH91126.1 MAG: hypothetical protein H3Bulk4123986_000002 [Mitovirus sp.]